MKNRKQCVRINNVYSGFKDNFGFPQRWIVGPILFDGFLNDFFFCITKASVHNFTHKILSSFAKSVTFLVDILIAESQNAIKLFSEHGFLNGFLNMVFWMVFRHFCVFFATLRREVIISFIIVSDSNYQTMAGISSIWVQYLLHSCCICGNKSIYEPSDWFLHQLWVSRVWELGGVLNGNW